MKKLIGICIFLSLFFFALHCKANDDSTKNFLSKPSGEYEVGFRDFHWINNKICPDPMFTGTNKEDFSENNPKYCREIMARIYYPTFSKAKPRAPY